MRRVDVLSTNKRKPLEVRGRGATVVGLPGNGWIFVALADEKAPPLRIQQRWADPHITPLCVMSSILTDPSFALSLVCSYMVTIPVPHRQHTQALGESEATFPLSIL